MNQAKKILDRLILLPLCLFSQFGWAYSSELTVHVSPVPPYVIDGEARGIACDLIERAFASQQLKVRFILSNNKRMEAEVLQKTSDAGFAGIPLEVPSLYFSDSVIDYQNVFVSLRKNKLNLQHLNDLSDKKIIAFRNASRILGADFASLLKRNIWYFEVGDQRSQLPMLDAERGDVIVLEQRAFYYFAQQHYPIRVIKERYVIHALLPSIPRYLGFHDKALRDQFNLGLKEIKKSGEYQQILHRYIKEIDTVGPP